MKRIAAFLVLTFAVVVGLQSIAQGPPPPQSEYWKYGPNPTWSPAWNQWPHPNRGACFYTTAPFRGNRFCVRRGDRLPALPGNFGGNISSVQIFGGATVKLFNDRNFTNGSVVLRSSVTDLRQVPFRDGHTWNNRVSSIIVY